MSLKKMSQLASIENSTKTTEEPQNKPKSANKELAKLMNDINKKYGTNAVQIASEVVRHKITRIPTSNIAFDIDLGGGIPIGRYTQISGAYSSTKTTQCIHILKNAQKMGLTCAMFDIEGTTDEAYLQQLGVDTESLLYFRPDGLEECTQQILDLQQSGLVHVALLDSIEALSTTKEQNSSMEETVQMGIKQKLLGEFFRKYQAFNNRLAREGNEEFTLIATNQLREKIGAYGDAEYTPGGRAKDFTASVDIRLRRGDWVTEGKGDNKEVVGQVVKYKIEKNKTYKRMQSGEFDFYFSDNDNHIPVGHTDNFKSVIIQGIAWGIIERGGAWFYLDREAELKFQGVDNLIAYLRENPTVVENMRTKILELAENSK